MAQIQRISVGSDGKTHFPPRLFDTTREEIAALFIQTVRSPRLGSGSPKEGHSLYILFLFGLLLLARNGR
jgi:hypothetical protein